MSQWSIGQFEKERLEVCLSPEMGPEHGHDWLSACVKIDSGGFAGEVKMTILFGELVLFHQQLEKLCRSLSGKAELKTIEGQLQMLVEVDRTGHITVSGELSDRAGAGNRLHFTLRFDQTFLWHTVSELDEALYEIREASAKP